MTEEGAYWKESLVKVEEILCRGKDRTGSGEKEFKIRRRDPQGDPKESQLQEERASGQERVREDEDQNGGSLGGG